MVSLGHLRMSQRDVAGARAVYQEAIESGPSEAALAATLELGRLLWRGQDRDPAAAEAAWQQVADSGHPEWGPDALSCLAHLLKDRGDVAGARAAWQQVIDGGHHHALDGLISLLRDQHDAPALRAAHQQALRHDDHYTAEHALNSLAWILDQQGDISAARATLADLIRTTEDPQSRRSATDSLRRLRARASDP